MTFFKLRFRLLIITKSLNLFSWRRVRQVLGYQWSLIPEHWSAVMIGPLARNDPLLDTEPVRRNLPLEDTLMVIRRRFSRVHPARLAARVAISRVLAWRLLCPALLPLDNESCTLSCSHPSELVIQPGLLFLHHGSVRVLFFVLTGLEIVLVISVIARRLLSSLLHLYISACGLLLPRRLVITILFQLWHDVASVWHNRGWIWLLLIVKTLLFGQRPAHLDDRPHFSWLRFVMVLNFLRLPQSLHLEPVSGWERWNGHHGRCLSTRNVSRGHNRRHWRTNGGVSGIK